ncbi:hypothetical protein AGOR_G00151960 [Albula goreensis]|uniref:Uncharacterized protein n=1 Tax=Albula goreensis TaxID=1534307 RepID=A0A8T3D6N7_9TELE|nr:hypothetical protein AGOR_G00151960 [Albula goreensis]
MESVYTGFESYNFEEDLNYRAGFKHLHVTDDSRENILKFKIFYYNRFVRPIELEGYKEWLASRTNPQTQTRDVSVQELQDKCSELCIQSDSVGDSDSGEGNSHLETELEGEKQTASEVTALRPQTGAEPAVTDTLLVTGECQSLSFAEVFRLIQAGEDVPGIQKLDVKPSLQSPTASQMSRRPKPWERTTAS